VQCLLPLFLSWDGSAPADGRFSTPPFAPRDRAIPAPPGALDLRAEPLANHVEGERVSVQWEGGDFAEAAAQAVADLDGAFTVLEEAGWAIPVSSERYYLPVVLDPELTGTGLTLEYYDDPEYPAGYPVIYVNPSWWPDYPLFSRHVAVHELSHAFQFAVRDFAGGPSESWYWEASAEWSVEELEPAWDQYLLQVPYYTEQPELRLDSAANYHPYGMLVLNAYLSQRWGAAGMRDTWQGNAGASWAEALEAATGAPVDELLWAASGTMASGAYPDSDLWPLPRIERDLGDLATGETWSGPEWLGTHYVQVGAVHGEIEVLGAVRTAYVTAEGWTGESPAEGPYTLAITALEEHPEVTVRLRSDDSGPPGEVEVDLSDALVGCGCASARGGATAAALTALALAAPRRRSRARPPGPPAAAWPPRGRG
jgi:hypothetical protein